MNLTETSLNPKVKQGSILFPDRINRMNYFIRKFVLFLVSLMVFFITLPDILTQLIYLTPIAIFGLWFADIPRVKDLEWNPWIVLLGLIPNAGYIFYVVILIIPGKQLEPPLTPNMGKRKKG
jgi:uncharacterized membrane protein YhaH (DUF805 family)